MTEPARSEHMVEPPGHHIEVRPLVTKSPDCLLRCECGWYSPEDDDTVDIAKYLHWLAVDVADDTMRSIEWPQ